MENDLREKPGYSLPDLGSSGRFQIISQDLVNRQSIVKWTSPDNWGIAFWPWDQMAGGTPAQREGGLQRLHFVLAGHWDATSVASSRWPRRY